MVFGWCLGVGLCRVLTFRRTVTIYTLYFDISEWDCEKSRFKVPYPLIYFLVDELVWVCVMFSHFCVLCPLMCPLMCHNEFAISALECAVFALHFDVVVLVKICCTVDQRSGVMGISQEVSSDPVRAAAFQLTQEKVQLLQRKAELTGEVDPNVCTNEFVCPLLLWSWGRSSSVDGGKYSLRMASLCGHLGVCLQSEGGSVEDERTRLLRETREKKAEIDKMQRRLLEIDEAVSSLRSQFDVGADEGGGAQFLFPLVVSFLLWGIFFWFRFIYRPYVCVCLYMYIYNMYICVCLRLCARECFLLSADADSQFMKLLASDRQITEEIEEVRPSSWMLGQEGI